MWRKDMQYAMWRSQCWMMIERQATSKRIYSSMMELGSNYTGEFLRKL